MMCAYTATALAKLRSRRCIVAAARLSGRPSRAMRTIQTFIPVVGLALGLASGGSAAEAAPAGEIKATEPLTLDLYSFQKEKFVTGDKTNAKERRVGEECRSR